MSESDPRETEQINALDRLPEEVRNNVKKSLDVFVKEKTKEWLIGAMKPKYLNVLYVASFAASHASEYLISKIEQTSRFKRVYSLFEQSKVEGRIVLELKQEYEVSIEEAITELINIRATVQRRILGTQADNYGRLMQSDRTDREQICKQILRACSEKEENKLAVERMAEINRKIGLLEQNALLPLIPEMLEAKVGDRDIFRYFTFLICQPKYLVAYPAIEEEWDTFPLKWISGDIPIPLFLTIYDMFKDGEDLSPFFVERFHSGALEDLEKLLDSPFLNPPFPSILSERRQIISESIACYRDKRYFSSVSTILPLIEGILWEYSKYCHSLGMRIYAHIDTNTIVEKSTRKEIEDATIGTLLRKSAFGDLFDAHFIEYFCEELYSERNPVLHGKDIKFGSELNAAKKMATLEYVIKNIEDTIQSRFLEKCEEDFPKDILDRLVMEKLKSGKLDSSNSSV